MEAAQQYRDNPLVDCHDMSAKITGLDRKDAKQIFLAVCYSMGGAKLCRQMGLETAIKELQDGRKIEVAGAEGQAILNQFDERMPFVRQLNKMVEKKAKRRGEIRTLLGRVIHFPTDEYGNFDWTHKALNRLIQGGSADQMKKAMIDADAAGIRLQLQVHDEVDFSATSMAEAEKLAQIMRDAVSLGVPSRVDLECGPSWGEIDEKGRKQCEDFYN
jgi:DNA polymerase I-like protein with 3'-5' exonuclease and polymerase domains